jgi:hypothetical protein
MLLGLELTGCPEGAPLDASYDSYIVPTNAANPGTASTTTGVVDCDDSNVNDVLESWCSTSVCHGNPNTNNASEPESMPLWLFSPTRTSDWLNKPAVTEGCSAELLVNTTTPEDSLMITSLKQASPCGVEMPKDYPIEGEPVACIEAWVLSIVRTANAAAASPAAGGTSAL